MVCCAQVFWGLACRILLLLQVFSKNDDGRKEECNLCLLLNEEVYDHIHPSEPVHSQQPPTREGKTIASTSFTASASIADPSISIYDINIQGDSNLDSVPTSKLEARNMTGNSPALRKERPLCYVMQSYLLQRDAIDSL